MSYGDRYVITATPSWSEGTGDYTHKKTEPRIGDVFVEDSSEPDSDGDRHGSLAHAEPHETLYVRAEALTLEADYVAEPEVVTVAALEEAAKYLDGATGSGYIQADALVALARRLSQ